jgi:hypothetical protein
MTQDDAVDRNVKAWMIWTSLGWNNADWTEYFAHPHTADVLVDWQGQPLTHGIEEHIEAMSRSV